MITRLLIASLVIFCSHTYADLYYPDPLYPEYESLLDSDPEKLILELQDIDLNNKNRDSLELLRLRLDAYLQIEDYQKATVDFETGLKAAREINDKELTGWFLISGVVIHEVSGELQKAHEMVLEVIDIAKTSSSERFIANAHLARAYTEYYIGNYEAALLDAYESYEMFSRNSDRYATGSSLNVISLIYGDLKDYAKSIEYQKKAIELLDPELEFHTLSVAIYNLARSYQQNKQIELAIVHYNDSIELAEKIGYSLGVSHAMYRLGEIYVDQGDYSKGEMFLSDALTRMRSAGNAAVVYTINLLLADLYIKQKRIEDLEKKVNEIEQFVGTDNIPKLASSMYSLSAQLAELKGDYLTAYKLHQSYVEQELLSMEQSKKAHIDRLQTKFHISLKESENERLKDQARLQQLEIDKKNAINRFNQSVIFLFLLLIVLIVYRLHHQTKLKRSHETLSLTDELTGLSNRRHIFQIANKEIERSKRDKTPCAIGLLDIDYFKKINDTYGHSAGDDVLLQFSQRIKGIIRKHDAIGRIGGEEWLIVFQHASKKDLEKVVRRMRKSVEIITTRDRKNSIPVTFSMGLTYVLQNETQIDNPLLRADEALYQAKENGRNTHCYA